MISHVLHAQENKDNRCGPRVLLHTRAKKISSQRQTYRQTIEQTIRYTHKLQTCIQNIYNILILMGVFCGWLP